MLLELRVAEQRFNAVMEVLRDGLASGPIGGARGRVTPFDNHASLTGPAHGRPRPSLRRRGDRDGGVSTRVPELDVFDGIVVKTPAGLRFADADQVADITNR